MAASGRAGKQLLLAACCALVLPLRSCCEVIKSVCAGEAHPARGPWSKGDIAEVMDRACRF